jgi:DNA invertase Pin-like site-specific DNA recombinase
MQPPDTPGVFTVNLTAADIERAVRQRLAFDEGRQRGIERARAAVAPRVRAVRAAIDRDTLGGYGERGRATRIAKALHIPRSTASRILLRLMRVSN